MIKLFEIIKKNFMLLIRSRSSALIILFGPLILMLLIGFAFNTTSLFDIKVGTYSSSYSELSDSIVTQLQDEQFKVIKVDSEKLCVDMIKSGELHVCTVFPADLTIKSSDKILFYVDKSRINFVYIILDRISTKISTKSNELSTALTNRLLTSINNVNAKLSNTKIISGDLQANYDTITKLTNVIAEINTTAPPSNFSSVNSEIDQIKSKNNISSGLFSQLKVLISGIEASFNDVVYRMNTIATVKDSSVKSLENIKTSLNGNIQSAKVIEKNIKDVTEDINSIEIKDVARIVSPISTEIKPISAESSNLNYTFPTLVLLVVLFAGIFLGSSSVMEEKTSKAYFRNFITPTKNILFVLAQYMSNIIIIVLQMVILFVVMLLITKTSLGSSVLLNILLVLFLTGTIFILLGMTIGYLFKGQETANIGAISIGALLLFFSNTILPIETLPKGIRDIVQFNPFILGEAGLKKIILFGEPLKNISFSIYVLAGACIVLFFLSYYIRELTKRHNG